MKTNINVIHWLPRIICILAILFVSLFALDAFAPEKTFLQQMGDFLIHLVPSLILIALLILAWKKELIGGIIFMLLGFILSPFIFNMNYANNQSIGTSLIIILAITFPFILVGALFLISYNLKKKQQA